MAGLPPWAALVLSDNTRVFYGRSSGQVEDRYLSHVFGAYRTVLEEHLPVNLLCDWNLTLKDLSPYRVIILPNTASIDSRQADAIRQYVEQGGGLVASLDTSLCDEFGTPRAQPLLADLFGLTYAGLISSDPGQPQIDINLLAEEEDTRRMADGVRVAWRLLNTPAITEKTDTILGPTGDIVSNDDALRAFLNERVNHLVHPVGTCKMGAATDLMAVVDSHGRVHGMQGLRVADAAIMPNIPRANTNLTAIMIGERIADLMRD